MWFLAFASFNENKTQDLTPIEFSKTLNVFKENVQCSPNEVSVNIDVGAEVDAQISLSVYASGSIVPPKFDDFGIITGNHHPLSSVVAGLIGSTGINASLSGSLDIVANASVRFQETYLTTHMPIIHTGNL